MSIFNSVHNGMQDIENQLNEIIDLMEDYKSNKKEKKL